MDENCFDKNKTGYTMTVIEHGMQFVRRRNV
jgi:hypothetical protein